MIKHAVVMLKAFLIEIALLGRFTARFFTELFRPPCHHKELLRQSYLIGYKSLPLVSITGFIMGLVLALQSQPTLAEFGAESWLPGMVGISIVREIGPVITALICAGRVGSGIGAELGSMKVTEQIEAMEVSGISPFRYLVLTRTIAASLMLPILVIFSDVISLYGSYIGASLNSDISLMLFFSNVLDALDFSDVVPALIKSVFFGFIIGIIGCYKGYHSGQGTEGVGKAANSAVVASSLGIFIIDMIAVQITTALI